MKFENLNKKLIFIFCWFCLFILFYNLKNLEVKAYSVVKGMYKIKDFRGNYLCYNFTNEFRCLGFKSTPNSFDANVFIIHLVDNREKHHVIEVNQSHAYMQICSMYGDRVVSLLRRRNSILNMRWFFDFFASNIDELDREICQYIITNVASGLNLDLDSWGFLVNKSECFTNPQQIWILEPIIDEMVLGQRVSLLKSGLIDSRRLTKKLKVVSKKVLEQALESQTEKRNLLDQISDKESSFDELEDSFEKNIKEFEEFSKLFSSEREELLGQIEKLEIKLKQQNVELKIGQTEIENKLESALEKLDQKEINESFLIEEAKQKQKELDFALSSYCSLNEYTNDMENWYKEQLNLKTIEADNKINALESRLEFTKAFYEEEIVKIQNQFLEIFEKF